MPRTLSMSEARDQLTRLPEQLQEDAESSVVTITRHGQPVLAVIPYELYESITETLQIIGDQELMAAFQNGVRAVAEDRTITLDELERRLGL